MSLVLDQIAQHARQRPEAVALSGFGVSIDYAALPVAVLLAAGEIDRRIPRSGPVAVALDNGPAWALVDLALMRAGRPSLPLPPFFTPAQTAHALADAGAVAVIRAARPGEARFDVAGQAVTVALLDHAAVVLPSRIAKVTYTSGSTGSPKGVCLSITQMESTAAGIVEVLGAEMAGVHAPVLPLAVLLENVAGLYSTLIAGGRYHALGLGDLGFGDPFMPDFGRMAEALCDARATSLILVPELLRGLMAAIARRRTPLADLTFVAVGGARVAPSLLAGARALGIPAYEGYGLTECASVVALNSPGGQRLGSVGRPLPHLAITLTPDGEVVVGPAPFLGYVGGEPHSGPVSTGDLGSIDSDGFLAIDGRRSNTIITAYGRNVSPEWVESELLAQPEIAQAAVFGEARACLSAILVPAASSVGPEAIEKAVARVNEGLPAYARIGDWAIGAPFDPAAGELTGNGRMRREVIWSRRGELLSLTEVA